MIYQEKSFQMKSMFCRTFYSTLPSGKRPVRKHSHVLPEISLVLSGTGVYEADSKEYAFKEGDVFFFSGNTTHYITKISGDTPFVLFNLQFEEIFALGGVDRITRCIFCPSNERIIRSENEWISPSRIMKRIHSESENRDIGWELNVEANVLIMFVEWVRLSAKENECKESYGQNECIMRAVHYIQEHLTEDFKLDNLAKEAGLSRTYFSSMFHKTTGMKVWEYIAKKRVDLAMQYLAGSDRTITEIALQCGFNHTASFYKVFKKMVGKGPLEFRRSGGH